MSLPPAFLLFNTLIVIFKFYQRDLGGAALRIAADLLLLSPGTDLVLLCLVLTLDLEAFTITPP